MYFDKEPVLTFFNSRVHSIIESAIPMRAALSLRTGNDSDLSKKLSHIVQNLSFSRSVDGSCKRVKNAATFEKIDGMSMARVSSPSGMFSTITLTMEIN